MRSRSALLLIAFANACSYVEIPVLDADPRTNGTKYVIGRTMELGYSDQGEYQMRVHPRGQYGARFGYVGIEGESYLPGTHIPHPLGSDAGLGEGMNEAGFTASEHTLRGSEYEAPEVSQEGDVDRHFVTKSLVQNCSSVDEAIAWLEDHRIVGLGGNDGVHWALADATGRSVVVEYLRGRRTVLENTPRVMTNDPPLEWHWQNLDTYVNISPEFPHGNDFLSVETTVGSVPQAVGHGWNLFGLPGDGSPPSRFVRLFYLRGYAMHQGPPKTTSDGIVLVSGLMNGVFIPFGTFAADSQIASDSPEYTPYAVVKIPAEKRLLVRSYRNLQWHEVDLNRIDFTKKMRWPIEDGTLGIKDITDQFAEDSGAIAV